MHKVVPLLWEAIPLFAGAAVFFVVTLRGFSLETRLVVIALLWALATFGVLTFFTTRKLRCWVRVVIAMLLSLALPFVIAFTLSYHDIAVDGQLRSRAGALMFHGPHNAVDRLTVALSVPQTSRLHISDRGSANRSDILTWQIGPEDDFSAEYSLLDFGHGRSFRVVYEVIGTDFLQVKNVPSGLRLVDDEMRRKYCLFSTVGGTALCVVSVFLVCAQCSSERKPVAPRVL